MVGVFWHNHELRYREINLGEQDEKGNVNIPANFAHNFDNGFLVGEIVRRLATQAGKKAPSALESVKADSSKNAKLTNWNFIWYIIIKHRLAFEALGLKMETRIKELILQGEQPLIIEVVRQLY